MQTQCSVQTPLTVGIEYEPATLRLIVINLAATLICQVLRGTDVFVVDT